MIKKNISPLGKEVLVWCAFTAFILTVVALLSGCGRANTPGDGPRPFYTSERGIEKKLLIFSAPWCGPCHSLHSALIPKVGALKKSVVITYVQTGASKSSKPTEEHCAKYKSDLGAPYEFLPDPWKSTIYKQYFGPSVSIPAAVILDANDNVVKKFPPGSFSAKDLLKYLE